MHLTLPTPTQLSLRFCLSAVLLAVLAAPNFHAAEDLDWYSPVERIGPPDALTRGSNPSDGTAIRVCVPTWSIRQRTTGFPALTAGAITADPRAEIGAADTVEPLNCLVAEVTVPSDHRISIFERPWLAAMFDESKHMGIRRIRGYTPDEMTHRISQALTAGGQSGVLIMVHGFNVPMTDSMIRSVQVAYDLEYRGLPLCFTWPSGDLRGYQMAERNVDAAGNGLADVIARIARVDNLTDIALIGHSMGGRVIISALGRLDATAARKIKTITLAAPDIGRTEMTTFLKTDPHRVSERITVYASTTDKALEMSVQLHRGEQRLGLEVVPQPYPGFMTVIDATGFGTDQIKHSYYGDDGHIISDLHALIQGVPAVQRPLIAPTATERWFQMKRTRKPEQTDTKAVTNALMEQ